ncbi:C2 domain-containing protein 5 isoform X1 [Panulirus ornatus]|uniref:C2 domain-containing protein 5 isoform X1 n=1 Tax=Panulirus ornatus TaxID=150431 RepID=UPI003A86E8F9
MPGKVKVRVVAGRNLPVMDRSSDTTDAYVEVKLGSITYKTEVYRKSLNPQWNSEWFRFEVDDQELQDEPLQIRLMDHDTYSANDAIGKVYVDLNPLLLPPPTPPHSQRPNDSSQPGTAVMSGWLPVYDTMHGIRGEVNIVVKVDLFSDFNKFRQSSCGVQFFFTPEIPAGYRCQNIVGFVEELVVNDDPEYQWIDKIRTPRASNEARQTLFSKLSGELQRRIGLKVLELGGNAVIGYRQYFDLEGETGIVVRGLGSAVTLVRLHYESGTTGGTTHSPSPLREITAQRDMEDELVLETMYVAVPNSDRPMPISVVHLPKKLSSVSAPPSCPWSLSHSHYRGSSSNFSSQIPSHHPSQWLDLMVNPISDEGKPPPGQVALTSAKRMIRGLPLVKRKRSATVTQHPPVYLQRNSSLQPRSSSQPYHTLGLSRSHKLRGPWSVQSSHYGHQSNHQGWSGLRPGNQDSLDSIRAGLRKTAQRMMKFRGGLEKSQSFDVGNRNCHHKMPPFGKGSHLKNNTKVYSPMGRLLSRGHDRAKCTKGSWKTQQSLTSPEDSVEDWDLDSPDIVEVIGMEEDDTMQYSDDEDEGHEVTNIEYSYKTMSTAFSDPTLNKSIYAKHQLSHPHDPLAPIQFISSDEDTCSSEPLSSDFSSPEHEVKLPATGQKFYLSEEEITSQSSVESHFTGPVDVNDLQHVSERSVSDSRLVCTEPVESDMGTSGITVSQQLIKSHSFGGCERQNIMLKAGQRFEDIYLITDSSKDFSVTVKQLKEDRIPLLAPYDSCTRTQERKVGVYSSESPVNFEEEKEKTVSSIMDQKSVIKKPDIVRNIEWKKTDLNLDLYSSHVSALGELLPVVPRISQGHLPSIAVIPSTPVLPPKSQISTIQSPEVAVQHNVHEFSCLSNTNFSSDDDSGGSTGRDATLSAISPSSSSSAFDNLSVSNTNLYDSAFSSSHLPLPSQSLPILPVLSPPVLTSPSSLSSFSSSSSYEFPQVASSLSMDSGDVLQCALDVAAKCPSHPVYISSLDLLVEARPGSASMIGSPKRSSRSRHTSGCYPVSRSPLPIETDGSKSDGGVGGCPTGGGTTASTNGGVVTSSPTHSGKLASPARTSGVSINRRSSDSDLSITPKGGSLAGSGGSSGGGVGKGGTLTGVHRPIMTQESFDLLEYPFLTMKTFPPGFILNLGGTVSARSVKLLDRPHTPEEVETRDNWWTQLRMEIRSHARALACNVVLGYEEFTTISDEVCVLNATGTAAVISLHYLDTDSSGGLAGIPRPLRDPMTLSLDRKDFEQQQGQQNQQSGKSSVGKDGQSGSQTCMSRSHPCIEDGFYGDGSSVPSQPLPPSSSSSAPCQQVPMSPPPCAMCHVPYSETSLPFRVKISKCNICRKGKVPDVLFTTLEVPARIPITGIGCLIQARVARPKRDLKGELNAKEISDSLPFLEYELHKQLINKMKIKGMNALFGLRVRVTVGERLIVGVATATAVFLSALQPPPVPRVTSASSGREDERHRAEVQKLLLATIARNKECYGTKHIVPDMLVDEMNGTHGSDTEDSEDDLPEIDLSSGNKDTSVLELDDMEDAEMIGLLVEDCPPVPLVAVTTQVPPGIPRDSIVTNLQMFTRVWRTKVPTTLNHNVFNQYFDKLLQSVYFKVRKLAPCIIGGLQVNVELPEEDELQISLFGMVLGQGSPVSLQTQTVLSSTINQTSHSEIPHKRAKQDDGEMIFKMEELIPSGEDNTKLKVSQQLQQQQQQQQQYHQPLVSKQSVLSITPVPSVPSIPSTASISSSTSSARSSTRSRNDPRYTNCHFSPRERYGVEITPLSYIPGARIECHLGNLNFFFIRESTSIKESGGLSGFMGSFVTEVLALVRAHVAALGGNAMISYFMSECVLLHNPYKNQGQCLINVGGDVVQVQYNAGSSLHDGSAEE